MGKNHYVAFVDDGCYGGAARVSVDVQYLVEDLWGGKLSYKEVAQFYSQNPTALGWIDDSSSCLSGVVGCTTLHSGYDDYGVRFYREEHMEPSEKFDDYPFKLACYKLIISIGHNGVEVYGSVPPG
jgi:hypothetical protein